jgi:hypothetical protein
MLVWRLCNDQDDHADCSLLITHTGAYRITIRFAGDPKFTALAIDRRTAQQLIDERREKLLQQGWKPFYLTRAIV